MRHITILGLLNVVDFDPVKNMTVIDYDQVVILAIKTRANAHMITISSIHHHDAELATWENI